MADMNLKPVVLLLCAMLIPVARASAKTILPDACGDDSVKFDVTTRKNQPPPTPPAADKAQIIFVETVDKENIGICVHCDQVVTRLGLDGAWVGANNGNSYFAYSVEPGVHHVCTNWSSILKSFSKKVGVASFTAEPGKTYYFQAKILMKMHDTGTTQAGEMEQHLDLLPLSEDEGRYLVKISPLSTGIPKK